MDCGITFLAKKRDHWSTAAAMGIHLLKMLLEPQFKYMEFHYIQFTSPSMGILQTHK